MKGKIIINREEWERIKLLADKVMKASNGHSFETILKTRCIYCKKSPKVKTKCRAWFSTFINELDFALFNFNPTK
jgi:hypothetical protein